MFLTRSKGVLAKGPIAILLVEDDVEVWSTIEHHLSLGFETIVVVMPEEFGLPDDLAAQVHRITYHPSTMEKTQEVIDKLTRAAPDQWIYYCYNAEYLFYPFCETRKVSEMLAFHEQERRDGMLTYVVDLYAQDLSHCHNAVSVDHAHLDRTGYYALARPDPVTTYPKERQLDFFGGLKWRFEEHIPEKSRKIDRISLFKAKPGLQLRDDYTFNDEEYNTYACPWHNNLTAAICSFRTAKALKNNPGSSAEIKTFRWHNSAPFEWQSRQLMDLGLMEPGQWF